MLVKSPQKGPGNNSVVPMPGPKQHLCEAAVISLPVLGYLIGETLSPCLQISLGSWQE
jgi:hypothetical protein